MNKIFKKVKELYKTNPDKFAINMGCFLSICVGLVLFVLNIEGKNIVCNVFFFTVLGISLLADFKRIFGKDEK